MRNSSRKKPVSFGILFWIAVILLFIIVFFANKPTIDKVLEETKFFESIRPAGNGSLKVSINNSDEEVIESAIDDGSIEITRNNEQESDNAVVTLPIDPLNNADTVNTDSNLLDAGTLLELAEGISDIVETISDQTEINARKEPATPSQEIASANPEPKEEDKSRKARIYFAKVIDSSKIQMIGVERDVQYKNNPMTETINTLLRGPSENELSSGLMSLIPSGTKLLSAWIRDGVAYLNFNETFMFNSLGSEGTIGQLQQIIYSTTEFSSVEKVQILIEGKQIDYLSQEGIFIGTPLGRKS